MTEEEAKTKWCPQVRLAAPVDSEAGGTAGNRFGDDHGGNFCCIGSACMAWRWQVKPVEGREGSQEAVQIGKRVHVERVWPIAAVVGDGFCGLANRPDQ